MRTSVGRERTAQAHRGRSGAARRLSAARARVAAAARRERPTRAPRSAESGSRGRGEYVTRAAAEVRTPPPPSRMRRATGRRRWRRRPLPRPPACEGESRTRCRAAVSPAVSTLSTRRRAASSAALWGVGEGRKGIGRDRGEQVGEPGEREPRFASADAAASTRAPRSRASRTASCQTVVLPIPGSPMIASSSAWIRRREKIRDRCNLRVTPHHRRHTVSLCRGEKRRYPAPAPARGEGGRPRAPSLSRSDPGVAVSASSSLPVFTDWSCLTALSSVSATLAIVQRRVLRRRRRGTAGAPSIADCSSGERTPHVSAAAPLVGGSGSDAGATAG